MGRLFWKLFLLIGLPQLAAVFLVSLFFSLHMHERFERLEHHGAPDREAPPFAPPHGERDGPPNPGQFEAGRPPRQEPPPEPGDRGPFFVPAEPLIGGFLATIVSAGWLAWLFSRPIRSLRTAFVAAARGDLKARVGDKIGAGRDELHDLGREFDRMVERLDALISGQRRLLHDVSHELRSPLARMQAAIGLAGQQPEQAGAALARIERESVRMDRLIGELLALARLQAGFTGSMDEEIELRELLAAIVDDASFEAGAKQRKVLMEGETDARVRGNVELLRRAIENVVRNAIKYSYVGGTVRIGSLRDRTSGRIAITVADAGPGVPEPDLQSIFRPFFRSLGGGLQEGHGLGLAIAKRVVEAHGGTITASNVAQGGLRVEIALPALAG